MSPDRRSIEVAAAVAAAAIGAARRRAPWDRGATDHRRDVTEAVHRVRNSICGSPSSVAGRRTAILPVGDTTVATTAAIVEHRVMVDRSGRRATAADRPIARPVTVDRTARLVMAAVATLRAEEAVTRAAEVVDTRAAVAEVTPAVVTDKSGC